jgi:uncharacterized protein (TIGR02001 family)
MIHAMKKNLVLSGAVTTLVSGLLAPVTAQAELEFNVGVFSDYIDSGESGSDNNAVVQGGVVYAHESGLFTGVGMSTLGPGEGQEVAPFLGYGFTAGELDFGVAYEYVYYSELEDRYEAEIIGAVEYASMYAEVGYLTHAHDRDAEGDTSYVIGASHAFMPDTYLNAELGYDDPNKDDGTTFWSVGVSRAVEVGEISLTYASRDENDAQDLFVAGYTLSF